MDILPIAVLLGLLAIFGLVVFAMVRAEYKAQDKKARISRSLGFRPLEPGPELAGKITGLYLALRKKGSPTAAGDYRLENVFAKPFPDGQMLLFDLLDTSGEDDSFLERQAVAVSSPWLDLPPFLVFPRAYQEGALAQMANKALDWLMSLMGQPVAFPESPEFEGRYLVSSPDPEAARRFLDGHKLRRLANTRLLTIHAGGDIFTCTQIDEAASPLSKSLISARVGQALELFSIFQS